MNYKKLSKEEIENILATDEFQKLTDIEAFDLMQRYNELKESSIPNDFTGFKKTGNLTLEDYVYSEAEQRYFINGKEYNKEDYNAK